MTFDVDAARILVNRACPTDQSIGQKCFDLAVDLRQACDEIEFLRKNRDDVERVKEQREAYATKLEAELLAARAVVDAARPTITNASEWKQDKFYVSLGALSEAIRAYDEATKAGDSK